MNKENKRIGLLFDSLRSPYDIANIIQVAIALDCDIYTSGSCIDFNNKKIVGKVNSWKATTYPNIIHFDKIEDAIMYYIVKAKRFMEQVHMQPAISMKLMQLAKM